MMLEKVILIGGHGESGKTTLANHMKSQLEQQGKKVCIMRFAQYIKMYLKEYLSDQIKYDGVTKTPEVRQFLQQLGTDIIRERMQKPLFHCSRVAEDIQVLSDFMDIVLIDDVRFIDEAYYMMAVFPNKVSTVRVVRLDHKSSLTPEQLAHRSETEMDNFKFDNIVFAQSGIQHLKDEADRVLKNNLY